MSWAGHVARIGDKRNGSGVVVGERNRNISRERYTCECEVRLGGWEETIWINVAKIRDT